MATRSIFTAPHSRRDLGHHGVYQGRVGGPVPAEVNEELPVSGRPGELRRSRSRQAEVQLCGRIDYTLDGARPQRGIAHHPTVTDRLPAYLELGLNQQHKVTIFHDN